MTPKEYLDRPYTRILIPDEKSGYFATIMEFPGCYAEGDTPNEAIDNLERAALGWIGACMDLDLDIPEPKEKRKNRIEVDIPVNLYDKAKLLAKQRGISLEKLINIAVAETVITDNLYGSKE